MTIHDSHIHVGQFREIYTSPEMLLDFLTTAKVDKFVVSSTSIWEEDYPKVLGELRALITMACDRVLPALWLTPNMLIARRQNEFIDSGILWRCVKIHGCHPWTDDLLEQAADIAEKLHVPVLMHTGGFEQCEAGVYLPLIECHPSVPFILGHARPIEQAITVMHRCKNAWADTAFVPTDNIITLVNEGFEERVLWGSDYPLPAYYNPQTDMQQYYHMLLQNLKQNLSEDVFRKITSQNFCRLFTI